MIKVSIPNLFERLKAAGLAPKMQDETNQIYTIFTHEKHEFPLFIRLVHEGELIQILTFIPCNVKKEYVSDVSRLLHMLNRELDIPGFCLDENSATVFFRVMIPSFKKEVSEDVFDAFMTTSQVIAKTFAPLIMALSTGIMTLKDVIEKMQAAKAEISP